MQVWRLTRTMPSERLNDAPVGHTSTHGGSAQCWHIIGRLVSIFDSGSCSSSLRIHCGACRGCLLSATGVQPFSVLHALTQSLQPVAHLVASTSMPQRTALLAGWSSGRPCATSTSIRPGAIARPAAAAAVPTKRRRSGELGVLSDIGFSSLIGQPLPSLLH